MSAIDVASYQPADLTALLGGLTPRPEHVVVRLYLPGERPSAQHSLAQIASARTNGCTVGGYVWAYQDFDPRETVRDALALAARAGIELPVLWLDCETYQDQVGPDAVWLLAAVEECAWRHVRAGIYTSRYYWRTYLGDTTRLSHLPLWIAQYDRIADPDQVDVFGGWTKESGMVWGKQYWGSLPVDLDIFREDVTR